MKLISHSPEETIEFDESEFTEDVQKHLRALEKFSQLKIDGHWGVSFDDEHLDKAINQNLLTDEEVKILCSEFDKGWQNDDAYYFEDVVLKYCEYSFYTIQGIDIVYVDENNVKHEVVWKD